MAAASADALMREAPPVAAAAAPGVAAAAPAASLPLTL